jgi:hypothetical protein
LRRGFRRHGLKLASSLLFAPSLFLHISRPSPLQKTRDVYTTSTATTCGEFVPPIQYPGQPHNPTAPWSRHLRRYEQQLLIDASPVKSDMSEPANSAAAQAPPKKRRRPALSCEQCRRRKIKCDRTYPCGQCLQSKTASCSYSPDTIRRLRHVSDTNALPAQPSVDLPNRARDIPEAPSTHASSTGVSPKAISNSEATLSSAWTSPFPVVDAEETSDPKTLLHHIKELVNTDLQGYFPTCESYEPSVPGKYLRGTVSKTRFFGPSHWMHSYGVVRYPSITTKLFQLTPVVR